MKKTKTNVTFGKLGDVFAKLKSLFSDRCSKRRSEHHSSSKDEHEYRECEFVWGVKSSADLSKREASPYTMNDMELTYSASKQRYMLDVETAYWFDNREGEIKYLTSLLNEFTEYMVAQKLSTNGQYRFWMSTPSAPFEGETISEVYIGFKIFVEGYKAVHDLKQANDDRKFQFL